MLDGALITDEELVLALEVPSNLDNYNFSLEINAWSENKLGSISFESPVWSNYDIYEDVSFWSSTVRIDLPSNNLLGTIEIPIEYDGYGQLHFTGYYMGTDDRGENSKESEFSKMLFWNTEPALPTEIDTVIISEANIEDLRHVVGGLDTPTYLIFENVETLRTLEFTYAINLIGVEFPNLKNVTYQFTVDRNPVLRYFSAPNLETVDGWFVFSRNAMIEGFETPNLNLITGYAEIQTNNKLDLFNLGGSTFGNNFSDIMNDYYKICWVFNGDILCDSNE